MVRLSVLRANRPLPLGILLVLITDRDRVSPSAIVRLEGLGQIKDPMASRIEPVTFRFAT
jgi:hypothetical protein